MTDLNIWPFYTIDSWLGCMKEYHGMSIEDEIKAKGGINWENLFSKLFIEFEEFILPM